MKFSNNIPTLKAQVEKVFTEHLLEKGYTIRDPQLSMVKDILNLIEDKDKKFLICEAEVGTGKSFAYLIPLMAYQNSKSFGNNIVISTATIALQEQVYRDIEKLKDILGLDINLYLSKGSTHFLCLKRLNNYYLKKKSPKWTQSLNEYSLYGDKAILEKKIPEIKQCWSKINVNSCNFTNCVYYNECGYISLREQLRYFNTIVITNHDQLIAHAEKKYNEEMPIFNENVDFFVIDEAHNLEEKAFNSLTKEYYEKQIINKIPVIEFHLSRYVEYKRFEKLLLKFEKDIVGFFDKLYRHAEKIQKEAVYTEDITRFHLPILEVEYVEQLIKTVEEVYELADLHYITRKKREDIADAINTLEDFVSFLKDLLNKSKIYWLEKTKNKISIFNVPIEIGEILKEKFFNMNSKFILTSGTISQASDDIFEKYMYFLESIGLDNVSYKSLSLADPRKTPYDLKENSLFYISNKLPTPRFDKREAFRNAAIDELVRLFYLTDGRAMVLFTSKDDMNFIYMQLKIMSLPWKILIQDNESSQSEVISEFTKDEKSILLSTGIFWEGIDIQGPSLSNLIIYKLPFPTPDPVSDYYKEYMGDNEHLINFLVPKMITRLRQGIGRLIRKEDDKGIISILDPRLSEASNSKYKDITKKALTTGNITEDFEELEDFVKQKLKLEEKNNLLNNEISLK